MNQELKLQVHTFYRARNGKEVYIHMYNDTAFLGRLFYDKNGKIYRENGMIVRGTNPMVEDLVAEISYW